MLVLCFAPYFIMVALVTIPPASPTPSSTTKPLRTDTYGVQNVIDQQVTIGAQAENSHSFTDNGAQSTVSSSAGNGAVPLPNTAQDKSEYSQQMTTGPREIGTSTLPGDEDDGLVVSTETFAPSRIGTTLRPESERTCFPGVVCKHGVCDFAKCACDLDWFGPLCDVTCVPACPAHQSCLATDDLWNPKCVCDRPLDCDNDTSDTDRPPDGSPLRTTLSTVETTAPPLVGIWEPLEGYGPLAPLSWRRCKGGPFFECRYGNCTMENQKVGCECEDKFSDNMCDKPCLLECGESGKCRIQDDNGTEECFCSDHRYRGFNCSILIEELQPSGLGLEAKAAVGVVAVLMVCLMMLLVVLYALWRRRNITMMKIVYWFHSFEEDDDRDCDAFVSYASADLDRQFVIQVLAPMLEGQMCFSLCLHQRDFLPGQYISHNISESVKRSRRTIMVVSPAYVSSDWCRFEFQMALQEMVSQKHRILPILLDDVGSLKKDMDETLKKVLEAVTWIKYPGTEAKDKELDQFWKRISLSMPKKRPVSEEQGPIKAHPAHIVSPSLSPNTNLTSSTCKGLKDLDSSDVPEGSTHHYEIILHEGDKEDAIFRVSPPGKDSDGGFQSSRRKRARTTLLPNFLDRVCGRSNSKSFSSSQSQTQTSESVLHITGIPKNRRFV